MALPKHNYNSDEFYNDIENLSKKGFTDRNIAYKLDVEPEVFSRMKNGKYDGWNEEENQERSNRICQALARGRELINSLVRDTYLKTALGGKKIKTVVKRYVEKTCLCLGEKEDCHLCGGSGRVLLTDKAVMQESEIELAPNQQALSVWLFNHDEEWRKSIIEGKKLDVTTNGEKINTGFQIEIIDKREQIEKDTDDSGL